MENVEVIDPTRSHCGGQGECGVNIALSTLVIHSSVILIFAWLRSINIEISDLQQVFNSDSCKQRQSKKQIKTLTSSHLVLCSWNIASRVLHALLEYLSRTKLWRRDSESRNVHVITAAHQAILGGEEQKW